MPSTPSAADGVALPGVTLRRPGVLASTAAYSRQPLRPSTMSPTAKSGLSEASTTLTAPPPITDPSGTALAPPSGVSSRPSRM